jgi:Flp pilus assembly protein TadG
MLQAMQRLSASFRGLRRFGRQEAGMAAVEFSLILPILVMLWIGGVEVTQALSVDRRLNNLAASIGDLTARSKTLTYSDVDKIFAISPGAMFPYSTTGLQMRVSAVNIDGSQNAKVQWSRASGISAYGSQASVTSVVPSTLRVANTQIIMAEVYSTYTPAVGYVITGAMSLSDRLFFVPRLSDTVKLCDNSNANCL